jgi:uncharacterized protein
MVLQGQFLERPTLIPVDSWVLEGLSHRGKRRPPLLIVPPPHSDGGSMDHVVAAEVAWAASTAGFPTLRFNYRGVGASQGSRGGGELQDLEAAMRVLEDNTQSGRLAVMSIGSSAQFALELARSHRSLAGIAWVSPANIAVEDVARISIPLLAVVGQHDARLPRAALSAAVLEAGGALELVPDADPAFNKNLPMVGKALARFLASLEATDLP